ncbi:MAG TPA: L-sorbose 1-phosphate reductase [Spirochaeta sp.]|nr:L-sorbose 1-phosphate reductase [Spirochaeta sp.]
MKTKAVRIYGKNDLRLEEFELPAMKDDEILATVISDSICMSSYKAASQGAEHKRVPDDVAQNPTIIGHEFCGEILQVGSKWADQFKPGQKFSIQPALNYKGSLDAPGYSFQWIGGDATNVLIPNEVMETGSLLPYEGDAYFMGSLSEPVSCIVGTYHAMYHIPQGTYIHDMGIREGGKLAILAGVGPMGLGAIDYAVHNPVKPSLLVVTDIDDARLKRAASIYTVEDAAANGVKLVYLNTKAASDPVELLMEQTGGAGYDDVLVMAPVRPVIEQGDAILTKDGCLNFFAGPSDTEFKAELNFYDVHYAFHHIVGTSGGNTDDMKESLEMMGEGRLNPSAMITHVGGLDSVIKTTLNLPNIPGGKKLIYNHKKMPLTAIADFAELGKTDSFFGELAKLAELNGGLWSVEAEKYLLSNADNI